jgi:branched-chain amino acid transport system substrate-binding protein
VALQLAKQILPEKPAVMVGPGLVAPCKAVAALLRNGPLSYCLAAATIPGDYMFSAGAPTDGLMATLIRYFRLRGWKRIAVISTTDAPGQDGDTMIDAVMKLPENSDVRIVAHTHFTQGDMSVSAQMETMKAADPQALIGWVTGVAIASVFRGMTQAGLDLPIAVSNGNQIAGQMKQYTGFLPRQLYFPAAQWPEGATSDPRVAAVKKTFFELCAANNLTPDLPISSVWEATMLHITALRALGPQATAAEVRDYVAKLTDHAGIDGIYNFPKYPKRGLGEEDTLMTRWIPEKADWVIVSKPTGLPLDD